MVGQEWPTYLQTSFRPCTRTGVPLQLAPIADMTTTKTAETTPASEGSTEQPWRRGFWSLIVTQFQGAFSDNALKNLVILVVLSMGMTTDDRHRVGELVGALFAVPFLL